MTLTPKIISTTRRLFNTAKRKLIPYSSEEKELHSIYEIFASSPEGEWILDWKNAKKIHKIIKTSKIRNALELGTGIGAAAAIMAHAIKDGGQITTIEQKPECLTIAKKLIPLHLQSKINFITSDVHTFTLPILKDKEIISGYENLPTDKGPFDFVLVDGPGSFEEDGTVVRYPNGDLFNLMSFIKVGGIVFVDSRKTALALYLKYLGEKFRVAGSWRGYCILEKISS